jgi:hypothetical protein
VLALAVMASSASAAVSTKAAQWYLGTAPGTTLALGTSKAMEGKATENGVLKTEIGGLPVELESTAFKCEGCKIENKAVTSLTPPIAYGEGKILFENVTVKKPVGCTVTGETGAGKILTKQLTIHADWMDTTAGNEHAFVQFIPAAGASTTFAQFELSGGECAAIGGKKNVTGSVFGESTNNTGVAAESQVIKFSEAIQTTSGGGLFVGIKPATFKGAGSFNLTSKELFNIH